MFFIKEQKKKFCPKSQGVAEFFKCFFFAIYFKIALFFTCSSLSSILASEFYFTLRKDVFANQFPTSPSQHKYYKSSLRVTNNIKVQGLVLRRYNKWTISIISQRVSLSQSQIDFRQTGSSSSKMIRITSSKCAILHSGSVISRTNYRTTNVLQVEKI
jgi:hypothetical protein